MTENSDSANIFFSLKEGTCFVSHNKNLFIIKKINKEPEQELQNIRGTKTYKAHNNQIAEIFCVSTNQMIITPIQLVESTEGVGGVYFVNSSDDRLNIEKIIEII